MKKFLILSLLLLTTTHPLHPLFAVKPKKSFKTQEEADLFLFDHFNKGCQDYNRGHWSAAANEFEKIVYFFPTKEAGAEASFFLGVCYFQMKEYDFANAEFSTYISSGLHSEYFEEAIYYKYSIAQELGSGKKRRPFKLRYLPKWISADELAQTIYDEVINTVPNHELAPLSLFAKGELYHKNREYRQSIDAYQTLIRRFPKNELAPDSYVKIAENYFEISQLEYQNPDILGLAELNARKFADEFPRDDRLCAAENYAKEIKEVYAAGLCKTGAFYERTHHPEAASIYYLSAIEEYPDTKVAGYCRYRLTQLDYNDEEIEADDDNEDALIPLDEEQPNQRPILLDPLKMDEEKEMPGYEIPLGPLFEEGKVKIE